jgi:hypothetical protein
MNQLAAANTAAIGCAPPNVPATALATTTTAAPPTIGAAIP